MVALKASASKRHSRPGGGLDEGMGTCARSSGVLMDIATDDCAGAKACGQLTGLHGRVIAFLADQGLPPSREVAPLLLHPDFRSGPYAGVAG